MTLPLSSSLSPCRVASTAAAAVLVAFSLGFFRLATLCDARDTNAVDGPSRAAATTTITTAAVVSTKRFPSVHHYRMLQEDDNDGNCELVSNKTLTRLLEGHESFVQDLFGTSGRRRSLQQDSATTVLLTFGMPSVDDMQPPRRHKLEIGIEGGEERLTLTQVKTQYRILLHNKENGDDGDSSILASTLLTDDDDDDASLWGVAVSGKIIKENGKRVRYQALVVGLEDGTDVTVPARSGIFLYVDKRSSSKNMRREKQRGRADDEENLKGKNVACPRDTVMKNKCRKKVIKSYRVAEELLKEPFQDMLKEMDSEVAQLDVARFQNLYKAAADCHSTASEWSPPQMMECINAAKRRLYETHLIKYGTLRNSILEQTADRNLRVQNLKLDRNEDLRECCQASDNDDEQKNRNLEMLWTERVTTSGRTIQWPPQEKEVDSWTPLSAGRQQLYQGMIMGPTSARTFTTERASSSPLSRRRRQRQRRRRRLQDNDNDNNNDNLCEYQTQVDQTKLDELTDFPEDVYRSLTASSRDVTPPADAFVTKGYDPADTAAQTLKFRNNVFQIELRQVETVELDITNLVETSDDVPRAISRFVRDSQFEATVVEGTHTNPNDGTKIEFVGVIFSRNDKKRQLLWPVEAGRLDINSTSTARRDLRSRQLHLEAQVTFHRDLQTVDTNAGTVVCTSSQSLSSSCVADAQQTYEDSRATARQEAQDSLTALQVQLDQLVVTTLDRYRIGGAECAADLEETGEGWNVTLIAQCLLEEKVEDISEAYVTDELALKNAQTKVRQGVSQVIANLRLERDNLLEACCEENVTATTAAPTDSPVTTPNSVPTSTTAPVMTTTPNSLPAPTTSPNSSTTSPNSSPLAPTTSPFETQPVVPSMLSTEPTSPPTMAPIVLSPLTNRTTVAVPTVAPTNLPTDSPAFNSSVALTLRPTASPTAMPTSAPSLQPTKTPSSKPPSLSPTHNPTDPPSLDPTIQPSKKPNHAPSVQPTRAPSDKPTHSPTHKPTQGPTHAPTHRPTEQPMSHPTTSPSLSPTPSPTVSPSSTSPTVSPTDSPTVSPSTSPTVSPTNSPTVSPSTSPTVSPSTVSPSDSPTVSPSNSPTISPTFVPTTAPSVSPTESPSFLPTLAPACIVTSSYNVADDPGDDLTLSGVPPDYTLTFVDPTNLISMTAGATVVTALDVCGNTLRHYSNDDEPLGDVTFGDVTNVETLFFHSDQTPATQEIVYGSNTCSQEQATCTLNFEFFMVSDIGAIYSGNRHDANGDILDGATAIERIPELDNRFALFLPATMATDPTDAHAFGGTILVEFGFAEKVCGLSFRYDGAPGMNASAELRGIAGGTREVESFLFPTDTDTPIVELAFSSGDCRESAELELTFSGEVYFDNIHYFVDRNDA